VNPELSRIHILADRNRRTLIPIACIPCEDKPCIPACPEPGAIQLNAQGKVEITEGLCTACAKCAHACQIGAIRIHRLPGRGKNGKAVALKCDQCKGDPWCSKVCPTAAIIRVDDLTESQTTFERLLTTHHLLVRMEK